MVKVIASNESQTEGDRIESKDELHKLSSKNGSNKDPSFKSIIEKVKEDDLEREPFTVRLWRMIGIVAGLPGPPGEREYQSFEKKVLKANNGQLPGPFAMLIQAMNEDRMSTAKVLHAHTNPHDIYRLMKESHMLFAFSLVGSIILLGSCLFAAWGTTEGCIHPTPSGFIPQGFMIISGLGTGTTLHFEGTTASEEPSDACLWMETIGVLFGVYTLLPCFGAVVLIRLLDNRADIVKISDVILLTKRFSEPCIQLRIASAAGSRLHNLEVNLSVARQHNDPETGEGYIAFTSVPLEYPSSLDAYALNVVHYADKLSPLLTKGKEIIVFDEQGTPRFHPDCMFFQVSVRGEQEQGGRTTISYKRGLRNSLIEPDEAGALPAWKACMVHQGLDWLTSKGSETTTIDISKLSWWDYTPKAAPKPDEKV